MDLLVPDQGLDERRHKAGRTETIHVTLHNPGTSTWVVDLILRDVLIGTVWRGNVTLGPGETRQVQVPWTPEDGGRILSVIADGQTVDLPYVYVEGGAGTETPPQSSLWASTQNVVLSALAVLVVMVLASMLFVWHRRNASRDRRMYEGR